MPGLAKRGTCRVGVAKCWLPQPPRPPLAATNGSPVDISAMMPPVALSRGIVVFPNAQLEALEGKAKFGFWEKYDDTHTVMRIATSWATRMEEVRQLLALL